MFLYSSLKQCASHDWFSALKYVFLFGFVDCVFLLCFLKLCVNFSGAVRMCGTAPLGVIRRAYSAKVECCVILIVINNIINNNSNSTRLW